MEDIGSPGIYQAKRHPFKQKGAEGTDKRSDGLRLCAHRDVVVGLGRV